MGRHLTAVDHMDVLHHGVGRFRGSERHESKSSGPARLAIAHHDLQAAQRFWWRAGAGAMGEPAPPSPHLPPRLSGHIFQSGLAASLRAARRVQVGCKKGAPPGRGWAPAECSPSLVSQLRPPRNSLALGGLHRIGGWGAQIVSSLLQGSSHPLKHSPGTGALLGGCLWIGHAADCCQLAGGGLQVTCDADMLRAA